MCMFVCVYVSHNIANQYVILSFVFVFPISGIKYIHILVFRP